MPYTRCSLKFIFAKSHFKVIEIILWPEMVVHISILIKYALPRPFGNGDTGDIAGLKYRDLTYRRRVAAVPWVSRLYACRPLLYCDYICQYKPKDVRLGAFGGQFACSRSGVDPKMIGSGLGWGVLRSKPY